MTVTQAIARSITHNEIVTLDYDGLAHAALEALCEGSVNGARVVEFWGVTSAGDEWRVHLQHGRPS
jgi:hypothetical protein